MPARILSGNAIRDQIYGELTQEIAALAREGIRPGLAAVLVGENPASQIYVRSKIAACQQLGLGSWEHTPPATISTEELLELVEELNLRNDVDGILVQLPLINSACVLPPSGLRLRHRGGRVGRRRSTGGQRGGDRLEQLMRPERLLQTDDVRQL